MSDALKGVFEIATLLIGVATLALLINRSSDTAKVVQSTGGVFNTLLETVTLQNSRGFGA